MKTSVLIFYLRLAKNTQVVLRYASYFLLVVVNLASIVLTLMNVFRMSSYQAGASISIPTDQVCQSRVQPYLCCLESLLRRECQMHSTPPRVHLRLSRQCDYRSSSASPATGDTGKE